MRPLSHKEIAFTATSYCSSAIQSVCVCVCVSYMSADTTKYSANPAGPNTRWAHILSDIPSLLICLCHPCAPAHVISGWRLKRKWQLFHFLSYLIRLLLTLLLPPSFARDTGVINIVSRRWESFFSANWSGDFQNKGNGRWKSGPITMGNIGRTALSLKWPFRKNVVSVYH